MHSSTLFFLALPFLCTLPFYFFFFNDTAPTEISPLSLPAALPILRRIELQLVVQKALPDGFEIVEPADSASALDRVGGQPVEGRPIGGLPADTIKGGCGISGLDRKSTRLNSSH